MKILATDFDGTLTNRPLDDTLRNSIRNWTNNGNLFGIVSGRPLLSIKQTVNDYNIPVSFLIANNDAIIHDGNENKYKVISIDLNILIDFFRLHLEEGITSFQISNSNKDYVCYNLTEIPTLLSNNLIINNDRWNEITQIFVQYPSKDEGLEVSERINEKLNHKIKPLFNSSRCADWVSEDVNKANGIKELVKCLSINPEKIITTGDYYNDLDMLICKDFEGYAVTNAPDEIKKRVGRIIGNPIDILEKG